MPFHIGNQTLTQDQSVVLLYKYTPVNGLPVVVAALFLLLTVPLSWKIYRSDVALKHKYYLYILTLTCLAECMAYICREVTLYNINLTDYIIFLIAVLLSPNALAMVNYMTVGKIIGYTNIQNSWLKPSYIPRFFVLADLLCFGIQGVAGGMLASTDPDTQKQGANVFTIGVILQLAFIASFVGVTYWADRKIRLQPEKSVQVRTAFKSLYATILLITVRTIYRTVEYETGYDGVVASSEWIFYVFDTVPILLSFAIYAYSHFIDTLPVECLQATYLGSASAKANGGSDEQYNKSVQLSTIHVVEGDSTNSNQAT